MLLLVCFSAFIACAPAFPVGPATNAEDRFAVLASLRASKLGRAVEAQALTNQEQSADELASNIEEESQSTETSELPPTDIAPLEEVETGEDELPTLDNDQLLSELASHDESEEKKVSLESGHSEKEYEVLFRDISTAADTDTAPEFEVPVFFEMDISVSVNPHEDLKHTPILS